MPEDELLATRREKLERLRADGIEPYPHAYPGVVPVAAVHAAQPQSVVVGVGDLVAGG